MYRSILKQSDKILNDYDRMVCMDRGGADSRDETINDKQRQLYSQARQAAAVLYCLTDPGPDLVFADEGHLLKNDSSALTKALRRVSTRRRVILTGTPLQNHLLEYHCMVDLVRPGFLGNRKEFSGMFALPIREGQAREATPRQVRTMTQGPSAARSLQGLCQRKECRCFAQALPPKVEHVLHIGQSRFQKRLSRVLRRRVNNSGGFATHVLPAFQAMLILNNHPHLLQVMHNEKRTVLEDTDSTTTRPAHIGQAVPAAAEQNSCCSSCGAPIVGTNCDEGHDLCLECSSRASSIDIIDIEGDSDSEQASQHIQSQLFDRFFFK